MTVPRDRAEIIEVCSKMCYEKCAMGTKGKVARKGIVTAMRISTQITTRKLRKRATKFIL